MTKILILFLLLLTCCYKTGDEKASEESFSVSFEKIHDTSGEINQEESWIVRPRDLTVDSDGNVYISDQERNFIQKFDSNLNFILKIGREGRGPGEFDRITTVYADTVLLGFSEATSTINKYSLNGEFVNSYTLEGIRGNPDIFRFNDGFIFSAMPFNGDLNQYYGIHVYDKSFERIGSPQLQAKEIYPKFNEDLSYQVMTGYGNLQFLDENTLVYFKTVLELGEIKGVTVVGSDVSDFRPTGFLHKNHAYAISEVDYVSKKVTIIDPSNAKKPITLSFSDFTKFFNTIGVIGAESYENIHNKEKGQKLDICN